jgi:hypothetical protein
VIFRSPSPSFPCKSLYDFVSIHFLFNSRLAVPTPKTRPFTLSTPVASISNNQTTVLDFILS